MVEEITMIFVVTNTLVQIYDIIWCRHHHCGNKNIKNERNKK